MNWIIVILISLLFSAFFSGMEIAFVSSNKMRAELDIKQRGMIGRIISIFYSNEEHYLSTILVGNNIALVIYGMGAAALLEPIIALLWDNQVFILVSQTLLSTLVILFTAEFLPKTLFRIEPNAMMRFFAPVLYVIYIILYPISLFTTACSKLLMRLCGVKVQRQQLGSMLSKVEFDAFIQDSIDNTSDQTEVGNEVKILHNALDFSRVHARDCMIPRTEIIAVDIEKETDEALLQLLVETGKSKVVVYRESIDNVEGYFHAAEMFRNGDWRNKIRPVLFVPESKPANKLMRMLMQQKKSLAIVIDEFGGTAGMVTLEDLVEEIFGDIEDEHDTTTLISRCTAEGEYDFSGRMEISKINEAYNLNLPESDDYITIAGYILFHYQTIPAQGETVTIDKCHFTVTRRRANRIELVHMKIDEQ